jgi:hypothetical protein
MLHCFSANLKQRFFSLYEKMKVKKGIQKLYSLYLCLHKLRFFFLCFVHSSDVWEKSINWFTWFQELSLFSLFVYPWGNKTPNSSVCLHLMPFTILRFYLLIYLFLFLIRPSARSSYFYLRNSWVLREKLTFTIFCFLFLIHVVPLVLSPFLFFLFLFGLNRV